MIFPVYDVNFKASLNDNSVLATGEIENNSPRDYSVAMFRIMLFNKKQRLGTGFAKVYEFKRNTRKAFEAPIKGVEVAAIKSIARYEILFESGY